MKRIYRVPAFVLLALLAGGEACAVQVPERAREQAAQYRRAAKEMISSGRVTDGVKMMRLAIKTNPLDPTLRMDYVTVMSRKGEQSLKDGNRREAIVVFASVEEELMSAAKLFKDMGSLNNAAHCLGQVADIHRHVYRREAKARGYYAKALELDPGNEALRARAEKR